MRRLGVAITLLTFPAGVAGRASAQTGYYNLDAGRPNRVEDATAAALYSLDVQFASLRAERIVGGTYRYRTEPKISYGVLPFTELELRVPVVHVRPPRSSGAASASGVASVGVAALRTLNLERTYVPAFALAGELLLPYGALAPPGRSYFVKALATKTTSLARFNANIGTGTYSVQRAPALVADTTCVPPRFRLPGGTNPCASGAPPLIFDVPCARAAASGLALAARTMCAAVPTDSLSAPSPTQPTYGRHWMVGLGVDRAFALQSTLLSADVVAERFVGLYSVADWTAEVGVRHQLTPRIIVDAGAASHFTGVVRSTSVTVGTTIELAVRPWFR